MDHAITVGEVLFVLGDIALAVGAIAIIIGVLWFMAQGWDH